MLCEQTAILLDRVHLAISQGPWEALCSLALPSFLSAWGGYTLTEAHVSLLITPQALLSACLHFYHKAVSQTV